MLIRVLIQVVVAVQLALMIRFFRQLWLTRHTVQISGTGDSPPHGRVSVILPVLDEAKRLEPCLRSLSAQNVALTEIVVVDGGSHDGTRELVDRRSRTDPRIRLVCACERPAGWNGKSWGLQVGFSEIDSECDWVLTVDADVRCATDAVRRIVAFADHNGVPVLSVATRQVAHTPGLSLLHPSLLSTLVYRFGPPGGRATDVSRVQSNGQLGLYRREALERIGGFVAARDSICEDVTLARHLYLSGYDVGFYEGDEIAETVMYSSGFECLVNWPRSLSLRDRILPNSGVFGLLNIVFLQVIPLALFFWRPSAFRDRVAFLAVNRFLLATRVGILAGMRRAYSQARWTYWLSPLADPITFVVYLIQLLKRTHSWRGQQLVTESE